MTTESGGTPNGQAVHSQLEASIAKRYAELGFNVTLDPSLNLIPFDLGGYRPDILAIKEPNQNYIIEVKGSSQRVSVDRFREISEVVQAHPPSARKDDASSSRPFQPPGGLMDLIDASLQRGRQG